MPKTLRPAALAVAAILQVAASQAHSQDVAAGPRGAGRVTGTGSELDLRAAPAPGTPGDKGPFANRGGETAPVLRSLMTEGVKFVAMGEEGGLKGYLAEAANGRYQSVYVAPDGEHVVAGLMFASGGANVTSRQISGMLRRFDTVARATAGLDTSTLKAVPDDGPSPAAKGEPFVEWSRSTGTKMTPFPDRDGGLDGYMAEAPGVDGAPGKMQAFYVTPDGRHAVAGVLVKVGGTLVTALQIAKLQERYLSDVQDAARPASTEVSPSGLAKPDVPETPRRFGERTVEAPTVAIPGSGTQAPPTRPAGGAVVAGVPTPVLPSGPVSSKSVEAAAPYKVVASDQHAFLEAVKSTVFFTAGVSGVPSVYMVADPQCPYCHEAWRQLRPLVFNKRVQVRVIMVAGIKGSDPLARSILGRTGTTLGDRASEAWLRGEGSLDGVKVEEGPAPGTPAFEETGRFLQVNAAFAERYKIARTPFLFYTDPEGALYTSVGLPQDFDAFLAALR